MPRSLRTSASEFVKTLRHARGTKSRAAVAAVATPSANEDEEKNHCSGEPEALAAGSGILINVTELAVNATFYKRRAKRGEVRILTIHPGNNSDPLSCTLQEHDIRHVPKYVAISYCWTYDAELVDIRVDDNATFKVPVHLRACLRRLRNAISPTCAWIDAICINQNDQVEKSEQVSQMPKIYSSSLRTVIWFGEMEPSAPTCTVRANGYCATEGFSSVEHGNMLQLLGHFLQGEEQTSRKSEARYLMRVWWKRLWCIQEFMLSPKLPKIMVGPHLVRWHDFLALGEKSISPLFKGLPSSLDHSISTNALPSDDSDSDHWQGPSHKKSLLELLRITYKDFACSDPKDRIFALIGITNDAEVSIRVDYARTVEEVYSEATAYLINAEGNVDMLLDGMVSRQNGPLPSWVPQFASLKTTKEAGTPDAFRASSEKPVAEIVRRTPSMPCGCTGSCLKLRAVKFDKIARRVALLAEYVGRDHAYNFVVASRGSNSDRLSHNAGLRGSVKCPPRSGSRFHSDCSFLHCMLETLAIEPARPPLLKLERLAQIGLLFSDYLFNGTQSLGKVMDYHHNHHAYWLYDYDRHAISVQLTRLVQLHRLPEGQALLHDLEVAMEIQFNVLRKIAKVRLRPAIDNTRNEIPESTFSPSGYERVFFKTDDQHLGVGPGDLQIGDEVAVPFGSSRPWVLRSHGDHHVLVGEAFVPGIMTGQLEELWRRGDLEYTDYVLR